MISTVRLPTAATYRVEVSGWDAGQNFFVAKADLHWNEDSGKQIALSREVLAGSVLFVRLLHATDLNRALPVPYQAEDLGLTPEGQYRLRLHPVHPRRQEHSAPLS